MNPWLAALIPIALVVLLGGIAFALGYRAESSRLGKPEPEQGAPDAGEPRDVTDTGHITLRHSLEESGRLLFRAPDERAVLVQYLDVGEPNFRSVYSFLRGLERDFGEHLSFAARHLPSSEDAWAAAAALESAHKQGKFREFLAALQDDRASATVTATGGQSISVHQQLRAIAQDLGLDLARFDADMADPSTMRQVETDRAEAHQARVERGGTFFLLDGRADHATSPDSFRKQVADAVQGTPPAQ